jgi:hypothetical protein
MTGSGTAKMEFDDVILGRRSIRGYKPDRVPQKLIEEILALAMRAPSSMNTQPWNFYVITGAPLDRIRKGNTERNLAGVPHSREFRIGQPFEGCIANVRLALPSSFSAPWRSRATTSCGDKTGSCAAFASSTRPFA